MTLNLFNQETYPKSTLSLLDHLAKILVSLQKELGLTELEVPLFGKQLGSSLSANHVFLSGKMLKEHSPQTMVKTFGQLSKSLPTLGAIDLNGNCLIQNGYYPKIESGFTLLDILQKDIPKKYFLSQKTIQAIMKSNFRERKPKDVNKESSTIKVGGDIPCIKSETTDMMRDLE